MARISNISSLVEFEAALLTTPQAVVHYWAAWCEPCAHMDNVLAELGNTAPSLHILKVEAEEVPDVSEKMEVIAVPFFTFHQAGKKVDTLEGADSVALTQKLQRLVGSSATLGHAAAGAATLQPPPEVNRSQSSGKGDLTARLEQLTRSSHVMLFMKGSPDRPQCGFSAQLVAHLRSTGIAFGHFDILSDAEIRAGLKVFSTWPTYPQLYVDGELVGGADIVAEMAASGELADALSASPTTAPTGVAAEDSTANGSAAGPSPSVPAVSGGQDSSADVLLRQRIEALVAAQPVMLFMKGAPDAPRCGFSRRVVAALNATGHRFGSFDILSDEAVRQGVKEFSEWPTFPQLFVGGELLGGCDIVETLAAEGSLKGSIDDMLP